MLQEGTDAIKDTKEGKAGGVDNDRNDKSRRGHGSKIFDRDII